MTTARAAEPGDLALYLHWPFCRAKCPYCDFNSHVREAVDQPRWSRALAMEMAHFAAQTPGRRLTSIFFGGGTPSLMAPQGVAELIAAARSHWDFAETIEVTLEANPTSAEGRNFAAYAAAGVGRVSLGIQSLDDRALAFLGRQHSAAEARAALALAKTHFPRVSFDLIYARPGQDWASWQRELDLALAEAPDHISLYQLTIEENTPFHGARRRGELVELDEEEAGRLFQNTRGALGRGRSAGLRGLQPRGVRRLEPPQSHLLARWRLPRHRARCPRPPDPRGPAPGHAPAPRARGLAAPSRGQGSRHPNRRGAGPHRDPRRTGDDGAAPE